MAQSEAQVSPLVGGSRPFAVKEVPRQGDLWVEGRLVGDVLVVEDDGGANYFFDLNTRENWSCADEGGQRLEDIVRDRNRVRRCYWSSPASVWAQVCGAQLLWRICLPARDIGVRRAGSLVLAILEEEGELFAVNADTGLVKWVRRVKRRSEQGGAYIAGLGAAAVAVGLDAYDSAGPRYVLVRASDGKILRSIRGTTSQSAAAFLDHGETRWLGIASGSRVRGFNLDHASGRPAWECRLQGRVRRVLTRGHQFVAILDSPYQALAALDSATGRPLWSLPIPAGKWHWDDSRSSGADLFVVREQGDVETIVRLGDGRVAWTSPAPERVALRLAAGTGDGYLVAVETRNPGPTMEEAILILDAKTGHARGRYPVTSGTEFHQEFVFRNTMYMLSVRRTKGLQPTHLFGYDLNALARSPVLTARTDDDVRLRPRGPADPGGGS